MDTAKPTPATAKPTARSNASSTPSSTPRPTPRPETPVRAIPMSSRAIAASLVTAFLVGGLIALAVPVWAFILIGLVAGALALYGLDRFSRSRG